MPSICPTRPITRLSSHLPLATVLHAAQPAPAIRATLALLRYFRAFLRSPCREMRDPIGGWGSSRSRRPGIG